MQWKLRKLAAKSKIILLAAIVLWTAAVAFGMRSLILYATTPGAPATPPPHWPADAPLHPARERASLVIFAHPACSCTRATLHELERILDACGDRVDATLFFCEPHSRPPEWAHSDTRRAAGEIQGLRVLEDRGAVTARLFGAHVSGQLLLYDRDGLLAFHGGITPMRGHEGDSDGGDAVTAILNGLIPKRRATPVFGCALTNEP
jgi:hypothetical protein